MPNDCCRTARGVVRCWRRWHGYHNRRHRRCLAGCRARHNRSAFRSATKVSCLRAFSSTYEKELVVAVISMTGGCTVLRVHGDTSYFKTHEARTLHQCTPSHTAHDDFRKRQRPELTLRCDRDRLPTPPKTSYHEKSKFKTQ